MSSREFAGAVRALLGVGFRFTVIGGSVVEVALGSRDLGDDIDVFSEEPDVVLEEGRFFEVADEMGWGLSQTWLGTPRLEVKVGHSVVPVEFYGNIFDFYVPESMIERARFVRVGGERVKMISVEDHIVLKANGGRDKDLERLREIGRLVRSGRLKVDREKIFDAIAEFDEQAVIINRLREAGIL